MELLAGAAELSTDVACAAHLQPARQSKPWTLSSLSTTSAAIFNFAGAEGVVAVLVSSAGGKLIGVRTIFPPPFPALDTSAATPRCVGFA